MKEEIELVKKEFKNLMGIVDKGGEEVREELWSDAYEPQEECERLLEENPELKRKVKGE